MRSLDIAGTGMQAQQTNVEVISNNIANMTTTGYKRQRAEFQDLIYQDLRRVGSNSSDTGTIVPSGAQVGLGVKTGAIYRINEQGNLQQTSNTLDMAIQGNGYFQVTMPDGTFGLSPDGTVVTSDGYTVQPGLTIPPAATSVTVNTSGQLQVTLQGQTAPTTVGQFQLATFANDAGLSTQGDNLMLQTAASGAPVTGNPATTGFGTMMQGFIETSNVNVVTEITNLITAQRAYEMNSQVITAADNMMTTLTQLR
jgi:flagellar basal-body rod protein FlgG